MGRGAARTAAMVLHRDRRGHPRAAQKAVRVAVGASADRGVDRWDAILELYQAEVRDSLSAADPDSLWAEASRERPGAPVLRAALEQCQVQQPRDAQPMAACRPERRAAPPRASQALLPVQ